MNWSIIQKAGLSAAFVAGGWLAATVAHGATPTVDPNVASLLTRVAALESAQAKTGTFTQDGNGNWSFAPPTGNVSITAQKDFNVKAGANANLSSGINTNVSSGANMSLTSASNFKAQAANATLAGMAQTNVNGAVLILNGGGKPLIDATAVPTGLCPQMGGMLQAGQLTGGSAPTVLVP